MSTLDEEAARRFVRLQSDACAQERAEIRDWIASDPRHAVAFARIDAAWAMAERLKGSPCAIESTNHAELAAIAADVPEPSRRGVIVGMAAAGLALLSVPVGLALLKGQGRYSTLKGERRTIKLPDGSTLNLNTASQVEVAYDKGHRLIRLVEGEALFDVAHDPARPFIVAVKSTRFRAVGTAFNVRLRSDVVELTVTEGVVSVRDNDHGDDKVQPAEIAAGGGAVVRSGTIAVTPLDRELVSQRVAWREGIIALDGNTIEQAVAEFNRYRDHPMVIGDPRIASLRIGGRFEVRESDRFLAALQRSFPIRALPGADQSVLLVYDE